MSGIEGQSYLITGGAGAIGRVVARTFVNAGANVVLADVDEQRTREVASDLAGAVALSCDLTRFADTQSMVEDAIIRGGDLAGAIHIAGGFMFAPVAETAPEDYDHLVDLNFKTTYNLCRAMLPILQNRGGGMLAGFAAGPALDRGAPGMALYSGAKAGVAAFLQGLADEMRPEGIGVSILYPMGVVDTPANRSAMPDADPTTWIDPLTIGEALVFAAGMAQRSAIVELPIYPPC